MTDKWPPVITMLARRLNVPKVLHVLIVSEKEGEIMSFSDHLSPWEAARAFTPELMALKRYFDEQIQHTREVVTLKIL